MAMLLGKLRTREHVLADLSINYVERQVLLCGGAVVRNPVDYGYDLILFSFNPRGEVEGGYAFFQVKATDNLPLLADGKTVSWVISRRDLLLWLDEVCPSSWSCMMGVEIEHSGCMFKRISPAVRRRTCFSRGRPSMCTFG
jgi:hypothetical protein